MEGEKIRYIAFEILCTHEVMFRSLIAEIWGSLYTLFGENGASKTGLWLITLEQTSVEEEPDSIAENRNIYQYKGIIRTNHQSLEIIRVMLALISEINGNPALIHVLGISGTIHAARSKYHIKGPPPSKK